MVRVGQSAAHIRTFSIGLLFLHLVALAAQALTPSGWMEDALRLTGESRVIRKQAIERLRSTPDLSTKLKKALRGRNKFLALDVISALQLNELVPELMVFASTDSTGAGCLTISTLINSTNASSIANFYKERLADFQNPAFRVSTVIMLDTLARMSVALPAGLLNAIFLQGKPEFRMAVLYYAGHFLLLERNPEYLEIVRTSLASSPYQLRVQALHLVMSLPNGFRRRLTESLQRCNEDRNKEVRALCRSVGR